MVAQPLIVVGAGGFGREALDVIRATLIASPAYRLVGVVDDAPSGRSLAALHRTETPLLGPVAALDEHPEAAVVIAIGSPSVRRDLARIHRDRHFPTFVHPRATIGSASIIGRGVVVCAGVQVSTAVTLGDHVHLNPNATIGHDVVLGDGVSVNPGAIVSGAARIDDGALIGAGAVILQGLTVGAASVVGAAACVVRDVPPGATVKGVPAR